MDTVHLTDNVTLSKSVEEMSINGYEPPQEYIVKDCRFGSIESSPSLGSIPVIDISILSLSSSHDPKEVENELEKLRSALSSSAGCFQAIGHGIPSSLLDKIREAAKHFFALPPEEKHKYSRAANEVEGYGHDRVVSEKQILDWSSRLSLMVYPEDQRRLNLWPQNPTDFKDILNEYAEKLKGMTDILFKAMEKSLNLVEGSFSSQFGDNPIMKVRFNFYPPCSRPDMVLGVKAHSDRSGTTILLQDDEVEGLQIFNDDKWINVPVIPHALVVNLGDQMQIMSNGIFKSPLHRVLTNTQKLRISVATFNEPEPDREIGPVDELIDEKRPRVYRNVKNFAAFNYECFQKGKVALDEAKV
uniref:Fe2OG dioxygenase domain-containing protein n=1 Tax=Fagus sylvatica TaxID=28930 RepID=A0A2N9FUS3_FAGSY